MSPLEKISALLAKAERSDNEHEKEAYFTKAQELSTLHSLSLQEAQMHGKTKSGGAELIHKRIRIGQERKHANKSLVNLFIACAWANDVKVNVAHNSTYVYAYGTKADIDVCETLWIFLAPQMIKAGQDFIKSRIWANDVVDVYSQGRWQAKHATAANAKKLFYEGFTQVIKQRLEKGRQQGEEKFARESKTSSSALVLVEKKHKVEEYYKKHSDARGSWKGNARTVEALRSSAKSEGETAGMRARLKADAKLGSKKELEESSFQES